MYRQNYWKTEGKEAHGIKAFSFYKLSSIGSLLLAALFLFASICLKEEAGDNL